MFLRFSLDGMPRSLQPLPSPADFKMVPIALSVVNIESQSGSRAVHGVQSRSYQGSMLYYHRLHPGDGTMSPALYDAPQVALTCNPAEAEQVGPGFRQSLLAIPTP